MNLSFNYIFSSLEITTMLGIAFLGTLIIIIIGIFSYKKVKKIQEIKTILEIRVKARTRELQEVNESLENRIQERTKDLEGSKIALRNMLKDAEESKKTAEEEVAKTLAIITSFTDGLLVMDKNNRLFLINPVAEHFFGLKNKDVVGKSILEMESMPSLKPLIDVIGRGMKDIFRKELIIKGKLAMEVSVIPIIRIKEKKGTLIALHDITREKEMNKMKSEFVSISAHQLRTPLSIIKWGLSMLNEKIEQKEQKELIGKIFKTNERMIRLVNDLLNIARIEEGRYIYNPVFTDIRKIIASVLDFYSGEIEKRKVKVNFHKITGNFPGVKVDEEKIELALQNLLGNAIKYSKEGGIIEVVLKRLDKDIEVSIKDNGIGISDDQKERVFTKFFRGANALSKETEGTGLGLFIAKNIINAHDGKIWFESKKGEGSTFYFTLPIEEDVTEFFRKF
ncbi:MAG: ATP-binding protein [Patescibacteria group bacterium]|nr:ATP-binding protein [Patescibacteria group bacterium]